MKNINWIQVSSRPPRPDFCIVIDLLLGGEFIGITTTRDVHQYVLFDIRRAACRITVVAIRRFTTPGTIRGTRVITRNSV